MTKSKAFEFFEIADLVEDNQLAAEIVFGPEQTIVPQSKQNTKRDSKTQRFKPRKVEAGPLSRLRRYVGNVNRSIDAYYERHQEHRLATAVGIYPFISDTYGEA